MISYLLKLNLMSNLSQIPDNIINLYKVIVPLYCTILTIASSISHLFVSIPLRMRCPSKICSLLTQFIKKYVNAVMVLTDNHLEPIVPPL